MWKQKISLSIGNAYPIPTTQAIAIAAQCGFEAISPEWSAKADMESVYQAAADNGLILHSLHAPFGRAAEMWTAQADDAKKELLLPLEDCRKHNIPIMVVHVWIGFDPSEGPTAVGLANYGEIVKKATEYGVKIAFENTEGEEYLFALMDHFQDNDTVGFCWDSGHELCYNHSQDLLAKFGDRLLITHLNDNLGIRRLDGDIFWHDDLHLLPYDGIADWDYNLNRLKKAKPLDIINFEVSRRSKPNRHDNDLYSAMSMEEYFAQAYNRACRIAYRYSM